MVTWFSAIPQATDLISNSQAQIVSNNAAINTVFNDGTNGTFSKYILQNVGTLGAISDPTSVLHARNGTGTTFNGHPIAYFKNSVGDYPLMPDLQTSGTSYSMTIGNMIIKTGKVTGADNNTSVSFLTAFPTACLSVIVSGGKASGTQPVVCVNPASISTAGFVFKMTNGPSDASYYIAIGY